MGTEDMPEDWSLGSSFQKRGRNRGLQIHPQSWQYFRTYELQKLVIAPLGFSLESSKSDQYMN